MQPHLTSHFRSTVILFSLLLSSLVLLNLSGCSSDGDSPEMKQWPLNQNCELHRSACATQQGEQKVTLDIYPKPVPIARMFKVRAKLDNLYADSVQLDISGLNMYMGYNRVALRPVQDQPGLYEGQSMLAFCTNDAMQWQLTVMVKTLDNQLVQIPFYLETTTR